MASLLSVMMTLRRVYQHLVDIARTHNIRACKKDVSKAARKVEVRINQLIEQVESMITKGKSGRLTRVERRALMPFMLSRQ
jgi:hypothetical protein